MMNRYQSGRLARRNKAFTSGEDTKTIQKMLNNLGFLASVPGVWTEGTTIAVRNFQNAYGLTVTGTVDEATWNVLLREGKKGGGAAVVGVVGDLLTGFLDAVNPPDIAAAVDAPAGGTGNGADPGDGMSPLLIGGIAVGAVVLLGGLFLVATRN